MACTNVYHNEVDCKQAGLPRGEWCEPCRAAHHHTGRKRFCNWNCAESYREDVRHGVMTLPYTFAEAGCCMYCGAYVPTNQERREGRAVGVA